MLFDLALLAALPLLEELVVKDFELQLALFFLVHLFLLLLRCLLRGAGRGPRLLPLSLVKYLRRHAALAAFCRRLKGHQVVFEASFFQMVMADFRSC